MIEICFRLASGVIIWPWTGSTDGSRFSWERERAEHLLHEQVQAPAARVDGTEAAATQLEVTFGRYRAHWS